MVWFYHDVKHITSGLHYKTSKETTKRNEATATHNEEATQNNDKKPHKKVMAFHIFT